MAVDPAAAVVEVEGAPVVVGAAVVEAAAVVKPSVVPPLPISSTEECLP